MANRTEVIVYGDFSAPAGTVISDVKLTFTESGGASISQSVSPGNQPVAVDLTPGSWTATAQAVDQNGAAIGPSVTDSFVILAPVTVSIPVSMTGTTA